MTATATATKEKDKALSVADVASRMDQTGRVEQADDADAHRRLLADYVKLIQAGTLTEKQAGQLQDIATELGIDADRMQRDAQLVRRAVEFAKRHAGRDRVVKVSVDAARAHKALIRRHMDELEASDKALRKARHRQDECVRAADGLRTLARKRGELFVNADADVPVLVGLDGQS